MEMANSDIWSDTDMYWSDESFSWGDTYEVIAEVVEKQTIINRPRRGVNSTNKRERIPEEKKFIKLLCIINDKEFSDKKYINKKLKVELFDEDVIIRQIKKVDISEANVKYEIFDSIDKKELSFKLAEKTSKKIKVEIKNIEIK